MKKVPRYHLILDFEGCDSKKLEDVDLFYNLLDELPEEVGMKKLILPYVVKGKFYPGVTGFVIIETSHLSFHSFSETGQLKFDLFSCKAYDAEKIEKELMSIFSPKKINRNFIKVV